MTAVEAKLRETSEERSLWEQMAAEADQAKVSLEKKLAEQQTQAAEQPRAQVSALVAAAETAAQRVELDEADTRKLIDAQLAQARWLVDSAELTYAKGARPEKGKNQASAEWPTLSGAADYALFAGPVPISCCARYL